MIALRGWRDGDQAAVDALLDPDPEPLWAAQGHPLHGPDRDGERWRRTWLAEDDGAVVGAVTLGVNWVHNTRYSLMVEVAPQHRRRGLGTALVEHAIEHRAEPMPMSAKVYERDAAGMALARRFDAVTYLRAPCPVVEGAAADVVTWCAQHSAVETAPLSSVPAGRRGALFADMYRWVHAERSPVGNETALAEVARTTAADADPNLSSVYWAGDAGDRVSAVAFVFPAVDGYDCVTETVQRDETDGQEHLAATIARTLTRLGGLDAPVGFDGHDSDPHLAPVLATLPARSTDPLLLVTIDAPRGERRELQ